MRESGFWLAWRYREDDPGTRTRSFPCTGGSSQTFVSPCVCVHFARNRFQASTLGGFFPSSEKYGRVVFMPRSVHHFDMATTASPGGKYHK